MWIPSGQLSPHSGKKNKSPAQRQRRLCQLRSGDFIRISLSVRSAATDARLNSVAITLEPPPPDLNAWVIREPGLNSQVMCGTCCDKMSTASDYRHIKIARTTATLRLKSPRSLFDPSGSKGSHPSWGTGRIDMPIASVAARCKGRSCIVIQFRASRLL